ncbi:MAG TPA: amidohydrolase [Streptosporangiaceae bacterium]|nr:amidohydrolase [Streptosporangiaceae bacterium]
MAGVPAADLVIRNARVYTLSPAQPWAGAVACRGGQIAWTGPDRGTGHEEAADWAAAARQAGGEVINAGGRVVLPGFIDSHNHVRLGSDTDCAQLTGARSVAELQARITDWLTAHPGADWIEGEGLDYPALRPGPDSLDGAAGGRPVFLFDYSGHAVWVNRAAMQRLGVGAGTGRLPFGVVERDARGEPTGLLTSFATLGLAGDGHQALAAVLPWGSPDRRYQRLQRSLAMAIRCGITTITEPQSGLDDLPLYQRAQDDGSLRGRLIAALFHPPGASRDLLDRFDAARRRYAGDRLRVAPVKLYIDDVIERHTAALFEPYADAPHTSGDTFYDPDEFADLVGELDARRFQVLIHAIGDRGVHIALNALEHARRVNGPRDSRHQLVHIELLASRDLHRFAKLGVIACMQPRHCAADVGGPEWRAAVGERRWPRAWPVASLHQAGAPLAFSSDWNVAEMDPLTGIYTALTRRDLAGGEPFAPAQTIGLQVAIAAYTAGSAYASFRERDLGRITPGRAADLIAVSPDPFGMAPEQIRDCHVDLTIAAGQVCHRTC